MNKIYPLSENYNQIVNKFDNKSLIFYCYGLKTDNHLVKIVVKENKLKLSRISKIFKYEKENRITYYPYNNRLSIDDNLTYTLFEYKKKNYNDDDNRRYKILINQKKKEKYLLLVFFTLTFIIIIL